VVAETEEKEPAPRSYPLRTIYPFPNDNPYYDDQYAYRSYNYANANSHLYDRYPVRTTYVVGSRIPESVPLVAVPDSVAIQIPATRSYSYAIVSGRVYLVDPATNMIVADVTQ